jgi:hypothetical protein
MKKNKPAAETSASAGKARSGKRAKTGADKTAKKSASKPETTKTEAPAKAGLCLCGCGGATSSRFVPGHDARLASVLLAAFRTEAGLTADQQALVAELGWEAKVCRPAPPKKPRNPRRGSNWEVLVAAARLLVKLHDAAGPFEEEDEETYRRFMHVARIDD